jgi:carboxylesterase type B
MHSFVLLVYLLSSISGSPIQQLPERAVGPRVEIQNGTVVGKTFLDVESFKGIPYAQSPIGDLRLRPPQPLASSFGTFESQLLPAACPQFWSELEGGSLPEDVVGLVTNTVLFKKVTLQSEDCLTLNIQRPAGTSASAKLPVVVWIFGGAFSIGAAHLYDGTRVIKQSVDLRQPIIFLSINYRLGGFGFLPGKEIAAAGISNLGLRDQRLALEWIQENIAHFGGDPEKVSGLDLGLQHSLIEIR